MVALPALGFMILPAFTDVKPYHVDLGPLENFPEGKFMISTFLLYPEQGEVSRRTAFVRNNGFKGSQPSFTIISNTCAHLGCPVQANGPVFDDQKKTLQASGIEVTLIPTSPAGFGCPCHGGQYDTEGNRTAGPPVRALDRYEFSIVHGNLWLGRIFSVSTVSGTGADAQIKSYKQALSRRARRRARGVAVPAAAAEVLMAERKPTKGQQAAAPVHYTLDWLEERSGLSAGSSTSSTGTSRTTRTGCRRSARRR